MDIEKLVNACKKEKDRSVADRMPLIIFIQRNGIGVTRAARRPNKARSWGVKWHRRYLEGGTDGLRDRPRSGRPPKVRKGVMKKARMLITKTACLLGGRRGARLHKEDDLRRVQSHVLPRDDAKVGILHEGSGDEARQQGRPQENCQIQEANEENPRRGRRGGGRVDGGRPRRVDRRGRFEAPKVGGGGSARWDAGGLHTRTTDPTPGPSSSGLPLPTKGDSSSGMRYLPRSLWTFWRRYASGSARP